MKIEQKMTAQVLRKSGESIKSIATRLEVSQGTVSRWCADIQLSPSQSARLQEVRRAAGLKALQPWIDRNKKLKIDDVHAQKKNGSKDVGRVSKRDLFMLGLGLYWGEGYKRGSQECGFTNSDPAIICTILRWFRDCYEVETARIIARVTINELHRKSAGNIVQKWSEETNIPISQFSPPTFITGYGKLARPTETYIGTLRIKIRNGTSLRRRILASLEKAKTK